MVVESDGINKNNYKHPITGPICLSKKSPNPLQSPYNIVNSGELSRRESLVQHCFIRNRYRGANSKPVPEISFGISFKYWLNCV